MFLMNKAYLTLASRKLNKQSQPSSAASIISNDGNTKTINVSNPEIRNSAGDSQRNHGVQLGPAPEAYSNAGNGLREHEYDDQAMQDGLYRAECNSRIENSTRPGRDDIPCEQREEIVNYEERQWSTSQPPIDPALTQNGMFALYAPYAWPEF